MQLLYGYDLVGPSGLNTAVRITVLEQRGEARGFNRDPGYKYPETGVMTEIIGSLLFYGLHFWVCLAIKPSDRLECRFLFIRLPEVRCGTDIR